MTSSNTKETGMMAKYAGKKVLVVGAHPDDIELGAGGTVARLTASGSDVRMVVVCTPNNLVARMSEARKAAEILGAKIDFLFPDKEMRVEDIKSYQLIWILEIAADSMDRVQSAGTNTLTSRSKRRPNRCCCRSRS